MFNDFKIDVFWLTKLVVEVIQLGEGGGEAIWIKFKRTATFFRATFPNSGD